MEFLEKPPDWLVEALPEGGARDFVQGTGWYVILGVIGLIALLVVLRIVSGLLKRLFRREPEPEMPPTPHLEEDLSLYPELQPSTGDRQLRVEGVPARLRLVVMAPAGHEGEIGVDQVEGLLDRIVPGLAEICKNDHPRIKVWPRQLSYDGFTKQFQHNMIKSDPEHEPSRWVLLGGRAKLGDHQVMVGMALQAIKPTTLGRRTIDAHEWPVALRVR